MKIYRPGQKEAVEKRQGRTHAPMRPVINSAGQGGMPCPAASCGLLHARFCPPKAAKTHTGRPGGVFGHVHAAAENKLDCLRACGRELCEAVEKRQGRAHAPMRPALPLKKMIKNETNCLLLRIGYPTDVKKSGLKCYRSVKSLPLPAPGGQMEKEPASRRPFPKRGLEDRMKRSFDLLQVVF